MISTYKTHTINERGNDFQLFLEQCKRAVNKVYGFVVLVEYEMWSMVDEEGETFWEQLKRTGRLEYSDEWTTIDFEYDVHIYAETN